MSGLIQGVKVMPVMAAESADSFIFGLDMQFLFDALILAAAILVLFTFLSYVLFNPARELMKKRQNMIDENIKKAQEDKEEAANLKVQYDEKLNNAQKEADEILSETRKKALKRENQIIDEAKQEAGRIIERAGKEAELEKNKMKDEVRKEMINVASAMAGKFVSESMDEGQQTRLINETLEEMGDHTWQN